MQGLRDLFERVGPTKVKYRTRKIGVPDLGGAALLTFCEKYKPVLIVDSLTKFLGPNTNSFKPDDMSAFFDKLLTLCAAGATVILLHHATRADAERYANSHQIGAAVARSFLVLSEDRPKLKRVKLEGQLFRSGEAFTVNLIAFPAIHETGHFGLADQTESPVDSLVEFVKAKGGTCSLQDIKARKGQRTEKNLATLHQAVGEGRLFWKGGIGNPISNHSQGRE